MLRPVWVRALASPGHPRPLSQRVTVGRWDYYGPPQAFCFGKRYLRRHKGIGPFFAVLKVIPLRESLWEVWRSLGRLAAGITNGRVFRSAEDPNDVVVLQDVADMAKARLWFGSDEMKVTMQKGGVIGLPTVRFAA